MEFKLRLFNVNCGLYLNVCSVESLSLNKISADSASTKREEEEELNKQQQQQQQQFKKEKEEEEERKKDDFRFE